MMNNYGYAALFSELAADETQLELADIVRLIPPGIH